MKSGFAHSLFALAAATLGMGSSQSEGSKSKPYNQRKARKARRQRYAAGDRHAFRR